MLHQINVNVSNGQKVMKDIQVAPNFFHNILCAPHFCNIIAKSNFSVIRFKIFPYYDKKRNFHLKYLSCSTLTSKNQGISGAACIKIQRKQYKSLTLVLNGLNIFPEETMP